MRYFCVCDQAILKAVQSNSSNAFFWGLRACVTVPSKRRRDEGRISRRCKIVVARMTDQELSSRRVCQQRHYKLVM